MRIRRNPFRILDLSSSSATAQVQPKAPLSEEPVLPPPVPAPPASHVDDAVAALMLLSTPPSEVCLQSCAWTTHPHALNPEELNDDDGLVGDAWREPRENPGLSYTNVDFLLRQDEEETESEVEEEIFLVKRTKVEGKIGKQQQQQQQQQEEEEVNEKLKRDGNEQKKGSKSKTMKAKVIAADEPPRCKKTDGRKWNCRSSAVLPHTLCEKHLSRSRSYYSSGKEAPGEASSKSAPQKASAGSGAAPAKASSGSKRARASAPLSITEAAFASDAPVTSKAAPSAAAGARPSSKRPQKKTKEDVYYSGGAFYYPEPFGPFRGKQRGHYSRPAIVEEEEERSTTQGDGSTSEAPKEGLFPEAKLSSKATRKPLKIRTLESLH
ncbi:hypothetical protein PAHAL_9G604100 [Panicum hallii]|uniref:WRC domain-containing protein n=1 Tax=Panicum hallii TaxID=206008 RepID=A0A2S3IUM7_9POAL|nr:hypothetical protein PAHAL_9G604100 [Panicum hallii]